VNANADSQLIKAALNARTSDEARAVQELIAKAIGERHQRPIGGTWNNQGLMTGSGSSYDFKALEPVTNMQDALLELLALLKFGSTEAVPFKTPHEAAAVLFEGMSKKDRAELTSVTVDRCGTDSDKKRVTLVMRDKGCGLTAARVPYTIFRLGSGHKDGVDWLQGTFGLGGLTAYRNAQAIILVTRRDPRLLKPGEEDRVTVAVVEWERARTTINAFYLVTEKWEEIGSMQSALPYSAPATMTNFEPGTHLCLIGYDSEGLGRVSSDDHSFRSVFDTRLFRPVSPIAYRNNITHESERNEYLDGLQRKLDDQNSETRVTGEDVVPFNHAGKTYQLPMRFFLFSKPGAVGERRKFVAHGHALLLTSNGQVHSHWTPAEFRLRTKLNKLYDRVLIAVETDVLPIEIRTELFTADRAQLVSSATAIDLEKQIASSLDGCLALIDANRELIKEAITGGTNDRPTFAIAEKISRAFRVKGFGSGGSGESGGGGTKIPLPTPADDLFDDPTHFEGPTNVEANPGKVKAVYFRLNAKDGFLGVGQRAELSVICDHADIGSDEITIGPLRGGRVRVTISIPHGSDLGTFTLNAEIADWTKTSGGLGPRFEWTSKLEVNDETRVSSKPKSAAGMSKGTVGTKEGTSIALVWKTDAERDDWSPASVGSVERVVGRDLAGSHPEYSMLKDVDDEVLTIVLNSTYAHLKKYLQASAADLTDQGTEARRDSYAIGVGVGLLQLDEERKQADKKGRTFDDDAIRAGQEATARGVLSVLPEYDKLARELGD